MKWNGRNYRPVVPKKIQVREEFNVEELLESLAEKHHKIPVWRSVVGVNVPPTAEPAVTPSPTPFVTPTMTPSPSPSAFNPSTFGDLQVWFDASDASTLTTVTEGSNTYVTEWDSKGILNYPISAETANRRPLYITNGGDGTKPAVYFQNTGTTREILFNRGTLNMQTTSGFTMFWVGRYAGATPLTGIIQTSPAPITMWNSNYTSLTSSEAITFNYRTLTDRQPITSGSTTAYSNAYEVNYNQNRALLNHSRYALMGISYDYTQNIPTVEPISTTIWGGNLYKPSSASSGYTSNFSTQGKNLNSFGMMGYKLSTTFTQSSTQNQPWEMFEVLVYNKPLTQNQFNQVESYLNNKWNLTGSSSNEAILNIDWNPGLEFTGTNFQDLVITGSTQQSLQWAGTWKNTNDILPLSANTQWYFITEQSGVNPPKYDFGLYDSSNNFITGATCFDATTLASGIAFTLSPGSYTLTGQARYDCVSPTTTPTQTVSPTQTPSSTPAPSVTPTMTVTPSATPPFSPSNISELRTWYDANNSSSITKRTGTDFIEQWNDLSGNGYHLTQSTAANQPLYTGGTSLAAWSGNSYVYFDGTDYIARTTGTSFSDTGFTYFFVLRTQNNLSDDLFFNYTDQAPPVNIGKYRYYQSLPGPSQNRVIIGADDKTPNWDWNSPATLGGKNNYMYGWVSGNTSGNYDGLINDTVKTGAQSDVSAPTLVEAISLGANNNGDATIIGYIAEIIVYGKILSTSEKNDVETYLKNKWNYNNW